MQRLKDRSMLVDLHILDNKASAEYKHIIKSEWGVEYQLVPPHIHPRDAAEIVIRTLKAHLISILASISKSPPKNLWDLIIPQIELKLNLMKQSTLNPKISAWEYFLGTFEFKATLLGPLGCPVMIHRNNLTIKSCDFIGR